MNNRLINTKVAGGGGGCTDIVDNYDPFGGNGVALYQLNGDATDESTNYNGTWSGTEAYTTGVFGQAGSFNGSSEIDLNTSSLINNKSQITISTWVKFDNLNTQNFIVYQNDVNGVNQEFGFYDYGFGIIYFQPDCSTSSNRGYLSNTGLYVSNQWVHIVMVFDGIATGNSNRLKAYINGAEVTLTYDGTIPSTTGTPAQNLHLGGRGRSGSELNGSLDQVRIFNTALTPLEVEALYTEELCICDGTVDTLDILGDGSCIATYQLDGNANDLSGNYSGLPTDVSYGVGEFDLSGVFNGSSSKIILPSGINTLLGNKVFSVSLWVKDNGSASDVVFSTGGANTFFLSANWTSAGNYALNKGGVGDTTIVLGAVTTNWSHIVLNSNGSSGIEAFFNGVSKGVLGYRAADDAITSIGDLRGGGFWFKGSIDQVRIFNKALSAGEVTTLYNETACTKVTRTAGDTQILGDTSCVAYYKLDGTADDETGTYNGTFINPNYGNGEFDYAGLFNGTSSYISGINSVFNTTTYSVSLWFNIPLKGVVYTHWAFIINNDQHLVMAEYPIGTMILAYSDFTVANTFYTLPSPTGWHNVVFVRTGNNLSFYVDGAFVNTFSYSGLTQGTGFKIGTNHVNNAWLEGSIDQVRIFNKAVSAGEVTTLYDEGI